MTILEKIIAHKKIEVEQAKKLVSLESLRASKFYKAEPLSMMEAITAIDSTGIIAEFKRKSPSKGVINGDAIVRDIVAGYKEAGVAGVSVLTDRDFFGANEDDFSLATSISVPLLRKDFIIDSYQVEETKAMGASVMLLIAACLTKQEIHRLTSLAKSIGLEVLLELHDEDEIDKIDPTVDMIGINNRNLHSFDVDIERSKRMAALLQNDFCLIAESIAFNSNNSFTVSFDMFV